jgi:tetratricopeptide (TPR) repeat protein
MKFRYVRLLIILAALAVLAGWYWQATRHDPQYNFLPGNANTPWRIYPAPPDTEMHTAVPLAASFRGEFVAPASNAGFTLKFRAFREASITLNGVTVTNWTPAKNWKTECAVDLSGQLRPGTNILNIVVTNASGPPALSACLENHASPSAQFEPAWMVSLAGAAWQPAVDARAPRPIRPGNKLYGAETAASAGPVAGVFLLVSGLIIVVAWRVGISFAPRIKIVPWLNSPAGTRLKTWWPLLWIGGVWLICFTNNLPQLPSLFGFDTDGHTEYIRYVQEKGRLPLADEGWQMYQPPLYYLLSAGLLNLVGLTTNDPAATLWLRALGGLIGFGNVAMIFLSLRRWFAHAPGLVALGTFFAGFLPAQFYVSHYITNEGLAATLATTCLYFTIRLWQTPAAPAWLYAAVGGSLGLALLAKFSTVVLIPFVGAAVLVHAIKGKSRLPFAAWQAPMIALLTGVGVCGWHYGRVWLHFGSPLIGNWSAASGFHWWQENGFTTATYFVPSLNSIGAPLYSGFNQFAGGLYGTLWADGLCSGGARIGFRPPWNYNVMIAAAWLALLPGGMVCAGALRLIRRWWHEGALEHLLWPGLLTAFLFAIAAMTLRVPSYAQAKAVYGLAILLPLSMCLLEGFQWFVGASFWRRRLLTGGLALWIVTVLGSFWIISGAASTQIIRATTENELGHFEVALTLADRALSREPDNPAAIVQRSLALQNLRRLTEAKEQLEAGLAKHRDHAELMLQLAQVCAQEGDAPAAAALAEQAAALAPDLSQAWLNATVWTSQTSDSARTISLAREALRTRYSEGTLHLLLGNALLQQHHSAEGLAHLRLAVALKSDWPLGLNDLAWSLATTADATLRNGTEAVARAEQACALTQYQVARFIGTLGAAYAEANRFPEAITAAQRARDIARASGQEELARRNEQLLELYLRSQPYHDSTP